MKITVPSGTHIGKALKNVSSFMDEAFPEYSLLKGPMTIYLTLKSPEGKPCPDNDVDYHITSSGVTDLLKEAQEKAIDHIIYLIEARQTMLEKVTTDITKTMLDLEIRDPEHKKAEENLLYVEEALGRNRKFLAAYETDDPELKIIFRRIHDKNFYQYDVEAILYLESLDGYIDESGYHDGFPEGI